MYEGFKQCARCKKKIWNVEINGIQFFPVMIKE